MKRVLFFFFLFFGVANCFGGYLTKFYVYNPASYPVRLTELHKP